MPNNSARRGAYFKGRTRRWLLRHGYQIAEFEVVRWVGAPGGARFPVKRDQWGADLVAMDATRIVFVQVKGGTAARGNFPDARRKFAAVTWAPGVERWIVAWLPRARDPRVVVVP